MLVYLSKNNIRFINKEFKRLKKVHSLLNYLMGTITIVAVYQALLKYPEYGTKLLSITKDPTAYSPTLLLSTLTAGAKSATYFLHKTSSLLKRKKQRKQLLMVIAKTSNHLLSTRIDTIMASVFWLITGNKPHSQL